MKPIIIIGSGMSGYSLAKELRKLDTSTPLLIISSDDGGFYSKPMLSNAFAQNKSAAQLVSQSATQMAQQLNATILSDTHVDKINTAQQSIETSAGTFDYHKLILAVGAQPIRLNIPGDAAKEILSVNNLQDYAQLRSKLDTLQTQRSDPLRVGILGAGLIGCEFADDMAGAGYQVTLIDPNPRPLAALAAPNVSEALRTALEQRGVAFKLATSASQVDYQASHQTSPQESADANTNHTEHSALKLHLANGEQLHCEVILSAVGLRPDLRLAQACGIATDAGILVDAHGISSDPHIFALGDCAQYTDPQDGSRQLLPYIAPILTAARAIARSLSGTLTPIQIKASPVIVKTPSCPIALIAPSRALAAQGEWQSEEQNSSANGTLISRFYISEQQNELPVKPRMIGFAVTPHDAKLRATLLAEMS